MTTFKDQFATQYKKLPLCNPDFIYLDGPDQFNIKKRINNFTTVHKDMMPMVLTYHVKVIQISRTQQNLRLTFYYPISSLM